MIERLIHVFIYFLEYKIHLLIMKDNYVSDINFEDIIPSIKYIYTHARTMYKREKYIVQTRIGTCIYHHTYMQVSKHIQSTEIAMRGCSFY